MTGLSAIFEDEEDSGAEEEEEGRLEEEGFLTFFCCNKICTSASRVDSVATDPSCSATPSSDSDTSPADAAATPKVTTAMFTALDRAKVSVPSRHPTP